MTDASSAETDPDAPLAKEPKTGGPTGWSVPASFYVWAAILLLTFLLPSLHVAERAIDKTTHEQGLSTADFQKLAGAEGMARLAVIPQVGAFEDLARKSKGKKQKAFAESAEDAYRVLATKGHGVLSARRVLILDHLRKQPLDDRFLSGTLADNLREHGAKAGDITSEVALWRTLYGKGVPFDKSDTDYLAEQIRSYKIGLLQGQALSDLYTLAERPRDARAARERMIHQASDSLMRLVGVFCVLGVGFLAGLIFLALFVQACLSKQWHVVGRVVEEKHGAPLPGGDLLDIFVAYLAIVRGAGLLLGLIPGVDKLDPVPFEAAVYVGTGLLAVAYLYAQARRGGWSIADLGFQAPGGAGRNILYGVAGYFTALPILFLLGSINSWLTRSHDSSLTPNPVLPMIAGEGSFAGRLLLFMLVSFAAPFFEELFFRGVLYSALRTRYYWPIAVPISAACFALVHPMGDWLPIFGLGCVLAIVREMRRSLLPGMAIHFCQNSISFLTMSLLFSR